MFCPESNFEKRGRRLDRFHGAADGLLYTAPATPGFASIWSNLLLEAEEPAVEEHFLDCGSVVAVRIVRDPRTGVGRGFGFVLFEVWETKVLSLSFEMRREGSSRCFIMQNNCHCHLQTLP